MISRLVREWISRMQLERDFVFVAVRNIWVIALYKTTYSGDADGAVVDSLKSYTGYYWNS